MKTKLIFFGLAFLLIIAACQQKNEVSNADPNLCAQMMSDRDTANMMMDCMMNMMSGDSSMQMAMCNRMMSNMPMMGMMMDSMMERCKRDTAMCRMMRGKMMNTPHMKDMMENMMK